MSEDTRVGVTSGRRWEKVVSGLLDVERSFERDTGTDPRADETDQ